MSHSPFELLFAFDSFRINHTVINNTFDYVEVYTHFFFRFSWKFRVRLCDFRYHRNQTYTQQKCEIRTEKQINVTELSNIERNFIVHSSKSAKFRRFYSNENKFMKSKKKKKINIPKSNDSMGKKWYSESNICFVLSIYKRKKWKPPIGSILYQLPMRVMNAWLIEKMLMNYAEQINEVKKTNSKMTTQANTTQHTAQRITVYAIILGKTPIAHILYFGCVLLSI